jgi:hypothetical protein
MIYEKYYPVFGLVNEFFTYQGAGPWGFIAAG